MVTERQILIGTSVALLAVAVWMFAHRVTNVSNAAAKPSPNYLTINQPNGNVITGTPTGISLSPLDLPMSKSDCGCGGSASSLQPNLDSLISYFNNGIKTAYQQYSDATLAMFPDYLKQYVQAA